MDKETFDKAISIQKEIDWLECNVDGRMTLPEQINCQNAAETIIIHLWTVYASEISQFCENLVKKYKKERVERIEKLKAEFDAL